MEQKPNVSKIGSSDAQLSKSILEMKFMKKSKENALKLLEEEESREMYSKGITEEMKRTGNIVFIETSIFNCKDMIDGRLSFGGMNPDIEKLMILDYGQKQNQIERNKEKDISDLDMAKSLAENMGSKFQKTKRKFIKPKEDF